MVRKCSKCQKEISSGKFYELALNFSNTSSNKIFCHFCADKEKQLVLGDLMAEIEWEIGNQTDEEILEFEKIFQEHSLEKNQFKKKNEELELVFNWCQEARQELEPYLQKPEIVEKSFGGKAKSKRLTPEIFVYYLFDKSAREENYRKEMVEPTIAKILGVEKLSQKINATTKYTDDPDNYFTGGKLKFDDKFEVTYCWIDDEDDCRRIRLNFRETKLALQSFCRALTIKEKELKGEIPEPNQPDNNQKDSPPSPSQPGNQNDNNKTENSPPNKPKYVWWISLSAGAILFTGLIIWLFTKKKKKKLIT